jgi:hypothetical protein
MSIEISSQEDPQFGVVIHFNGYHFYRIDNEQQTAVEPMNTPPEVREELQSFIDEFFTKGE